MSYEATMWNSVDLIKKKNDTRELVHKTETDSKVS